MTVTAKITAKMTGAKITRAPTPLNQSYAQASEVANDMTVFVSTAEEDLATGDLLNPKYLLIRNASTSTDALVTFGPKSSSGALIDFASLRYDEENYITLASSDVTVAIKASTATTPVDVRMWDA